MSLEVLESGWDIPRVTYSTSNTARRKVPIRTYCCRLFQVQDSLFTPPPPYPSPFSPTLLPLPFPSSPRRPTTPLTITYQQHSSVACRSPALTTYDTSSITVSNACTGPLPTPQTTQPPIPHTKSSQVEEKLKLLA